MLSALSACFCVTYALIEWLPETVNNYLFRIKYLSTARYSLPHFNLPSKFYPLSSTNYSHSTKFYLLSSTH